MKNFDLIISVRRRRFAREKKYEAAVKRQLNEAESNLATTKNALQDFVNDMKTLEIRLLSEILEKETTAWTIEKINFELQRAREDAVALSRKHDELEKAVFLKSEELKAAILRSQLASRKLEKLEEANSALLKEEDVLERQLEDARSEEVSDMIYVAKFGRG